MIAYFILGVCLLIGGSLILLGRTGAPRVDAHSASGRGLLVFCRKLPATCGVVAIPNEVFYARPEFGRHMVRFAYCKQLSVIDEAAAALASGFAR